MGFAFFYVCSGCLCAHSRDERIPGIGNLDDPEDFRMRELYKPGVDAALRQRLDILKLCFASWARQLGTALTWSEFKTNCYDAMVARHNRRSHEEFVLSEVAVRVCFELSKMTVVDERMTAMRKATLAHDYAGSSSSTTTRGQGLFSSDVVHLPNHATALTFVDFLECVAHMARAHHVETRRLEREALKREERKEGAKLSNSPLYKMMMGDTSSDDDDDTDDAQTARDLKGRGKGKMVPKSNVPGKSSKKKKKATGDASGSKGPTVMAHLDEMIAEYIDDILRPLIDVKSTRRRQSVVNRLKLLDRSYGRAGVGRRLPGSGNNKTNNDRRVGGVAKVVGTTAIPFLSRLPGTKTRSKSSTAVLRTGKFSRAGPPPSVVEPRRSSTTGGAGRRERRRRATLANVSEFGKSSRRVVRCTGMVRIDERAGVYLEAGASAWSLEDSVFAMRAETSDAKDFYDTDDVLRACFEADWRNLSRKARFVNMIDLYDDDGGDQEMTEVKEVLWNMYGTIADAFEFYGVMGDTPASSHLIEWSAYRRFIHDCHIADYGTCKQATVDAIFDIENEEENAEDSGDDGGEDGGEDGGGDNENEDEKDGTGKDGAAEGEGGQGEAAAEVSTSAMNEINDDRALMRFEFLGCIVRLSVAKYVKSGATDDVSDAVCLLCDRNIDAHLGPAAIHDSNEFRKDRLYLREVDKILTAAAPRLRRVYSAFGKHDELGEGTRMTMNEWLSFVEAAGLLGEDFELREAKLAFAWAQMAVVDEVGNRARFVSLSFYDFLEAVARVCDLKALPTDGELKAEGMTHASRFLEDLEDDGGDRLRAFYDAHPSEWNIKKTRSIAELLPKLLDVVFYNLNRDAETPF